MNIESAKKGAAEQKMPKPRHSHRTRRQVHRKIQRQKVHKQKVHKQTQQSPKQKQRKMALYL